MALDRLSARRRRTLTLGTLVHFSHFDHINADFLHVNAIFYVTVFINPSSYVDACQKGIIVKVDADSKI